MIEILTGLLVVITGTYALFTFKILKANENIVKQMRTQQEAMFRPYVSISPIVFPENIIFFLKIKNTGLTSAKNLKLSIDRDVCLRMKVDFYEPILRDTYLLHAHILSQHSSDCSSFL